MQLTKWKLSTHTSHLLDSGERTSITSQHDRPVALASDSLREDPKEKDKSNKSERTTQPVARKLLRTFQPNRMQEITPNKPQRIMEEIIRNCWLAMNSDHNCQSRRRKLIYWAEGTNLYHRSRECQITKTKKAIDKSSHRQVITFGESERLSWVSLQPTDLTKPILVHQSWKTTKCSSNKDSVKWSGQLDTLKLHQSMTTHHQASHAWICKTANPMDILFRTSIVFSKGFNQFWAKDHDFYCFYFCMQ